nr:hypothetical protein Iba_chr12dCG11930 [Ipomoea batatas]
MVAYGVVSVQYLLGGCALLIVCIGLWLEDVFYSCIMFEDGKGIWVCFGAGSVPSLYDNVCNCCSVCVNTTTFSSGRVLNGVVVFAREDTTKFVKLLWFCSMREIAHPSFEYAIDAGICVAIFPISLVSNPLTALVNLYLDERKGGVGDFKFLVLICMSSLFGAVVVYDVCSGVVCAICFLQCLAICMQVYEVQGWHLPNKDKGRQKDITLKSKQRKETCQGRCDISTPSKKNGEIKEQEQEQRYGKKAEARKENSKEAKKERQGKFAIHLNKARSRVETYSFVNHKVSKYLQNVNTEQARANSNSMMLVSGSRFVQLWIQLIVLSDANCFSLENQQNVPDLRQPAKQKGI